MGGAGVTSDELTAKASDVLQGKTYMGADTGDEAGTGSIPVYEGRTVTPGTANQIIAAGQYLGGNVTVAGSSNLTAANIKSGVNLFGVVGSCREYKDILKQANSAGNFSTKVRVGSSSASLTSRTFPFVKLTNVGFTPVKMYYKQGSAYYTCIAIYQTDMSGIEMMTANGDYYFFPAPSSDNPNIIITKDLIQVPIINYTDRYYAYITACGY